VNVKTIHKFPLDEEKSRQLIAVPVTAKFISVIEQHGKPVIYALVDTVLRITEAEVVILTTGEEINPSLLLSHICLGTVSLRGGAYIIHVFVERTASYL
jgi:hypothetical protein